MPPPPPTYDCEENVECPNGLGGDLALVAALVPQLHRLDPECPLRAGLLVEGLEAQVRRVRVAAHRQDAQVAASDPRHLVRKTRLG